LLRLHDFFVGGEEDSTSGLLGEAACRPFNGFGLLDDERHRVLGGLLIGPIAILLGLVAIPVAEGRAVLVAMSRLLLMATSAVPIAIPSSVPISIPVPSVPIEIIVASTALVVRPADSTLGARSADLSLGARLAILALGARLLVALVLVAGALQAYAGLLDDAGRGLLDRAARRLIDDIGLLDGDGCRLHTPCMVRTAFTCVLVVSGDSRRYELTI
jgi:hypothetical protein